MPPPLPEELLEEIFLRLPPDEPACLVRASLAGKLWLALLTGPAFRSRYGEHHGAPPMLGFLLSWIPYSHEEDRPATHFVSTAKFGARITNWRGREYNTLDCRHGRVLLADTSSARLTKLAVWDPMTGFRRELVTPFESFGLGAAVLCAVTGCDHRSCHGGPFGVLLFGLTVQDVGGDHRFAHAWVYSSVSDEWSKPCSPLQLGSLYALIQQKPSLLFENAIYHKILCPDHTAILKYDIGSNCMSLLDGPPGVKIDTSAILMVMENEGLGFTYLDCFTLYRWSRRVRFDGVTMWTQRRLVDLKKLLPIQDPKANYRLIGFKEGSGIIFVTTDIGIYEINLKSLEWKKLWKRENIRALIPYMTFYNRPERVNPL